MKFKLERLSLLEKLRELETMYNNEDDEDFKEFRTPGLTTEENNEDDTHSIEGDEAFARKLLLEEKRMISEGAKTQNRLQEDFEIGMDEILNDGKLSQDLTQLEKDARFASQLEKIFQSQQQNQIDEDEKLARYLSDQESFNNRNPPVGAYTPPQTLPIGIKKKPIPHRPKLPVNSIITMNKTTPQLRSHAVVVHNTYCNCRKTDAGNNGHLFKTHDQYCKCTKLHMKS